MDNQRDGGSCEHNDSRSEQRGGVLGQTHFAESGVKRCSRCREEKSISLFYRCKRYKDGVRSECKECINKNNIERDRLKRQGFRNGWRGEAAVETEQVCCADIAIRLDGDCWRKPPEVTVKKEDLLMWYSDFKKSGGNRSAPFFDDRGWFSWVAARFELNMLRGVG